MSIKIYIENFWEGEQKDELFVCMPFDDSLDEKFHEKIDGAAKKAGLDKATRVKEDIDANVITENIIDGIANSKMLLFDLSDDPKALCEHTKQVTGNVLYELGVAQAIRDKQDIILIKERSSSRLPFDIKDINVNFHDGELEIEWLYELLKTALDKQEWHRSKRVESAAKSIDHGGYDLMLKHGRLPEGYNHFPLEGETNNSATRLIDLNILWFASRMHTQIHGECAYRWTTFGRAVMTYLGIQQMTEEEYKKTDLYEGYMKWQKQYKLNLEEIKKTTKDQ